MKKNVFLIAATVASACLLFTSCKKKEVEDNDTEGVKDHAFAETTSNDVFNIGVQASYNNLSTYKLSNSGTDLSTCAVITFDTLNNLDPDTIDVDFGTTGCAPTYGRTRKGLIRYIYTAGKHYRDSACVINVSTPGNTYYVDNNQVMISSKTITNMGHVGSYLTWNVTASITVNRSTGGHFSWNTNKTKVLIAGEKPLNQPIDWPNAKIGVYGSANGTNAKGESFSANVSQANMLVRDFTCGSFRRFFVKGIMEFTPGSKPTRYINFGTGNCDDAAVVTINGHAYNVTLH
ncbi:MAG: hypothetical protein ACXVPN_00905 [Bacteroidia bacterium]